MVARNIDFTITLPCIQTNKQTRKETNRKGNKERQKKYTYVKLNSH